MVFLGIRPVGVRDRGILHGWPFRPPPVVFERASVKRNLGAHVRSNHLLYFGEAPFAG